MVGGGIAGLAAAWELVTGPGWEGASPPTVHVFEAGADVGGKLRSAEFAGRRVDLAADAFLARRPEATELCLEIGLGGDLVPVGASGASIWARGRLRAMPARLNLGVPTRWWPLARSGILGPTESLRVAKDVVLPHFASGVIIGDRSVGEIVSERLGRPVVDRLVDPLVGGIHAGGVDDLSAAATFPALIAAATQPGSLMHRLGRVGASASRSSPSAPPGPGGPAAGPSGPRPSATSPVPPATEPSAGPLFWSLTGTTASLVDGLVAALEARGVQIHTGTRVDAVDGSGSTGGRWSLALSRADGAQSNGSRADGSRADRARSDGAPSTVDGVVIAVPAPEAAVLLAPHAPVAAGMLSVIDYASVAVVTLSVPPGSIGGRLTGTGFLVPRTSVIDDHPALITGVTYLGRKWPHLARPDEELIRASVGRFGDERHQRLGDDELQASVVGELGTLLGLRGAPRETLVTRWENAFPQYRPGHLLRVAKIEEDVGRLVGVALAGAALRGVGIPACIGSGRTAARHVMASVGVNSGNSRGGAGQGPT